MGTTKSESLKGAPTPLGRLLHLLYTDPMRTQSTQFQVAMTSFVLVLGVQACKAPTTADPAQPHAPTINIINWNTYHLFDHRAKIEPATQWLAEQAPDLLALQEMLHINELGLQELAKSWGHEYAVMHKEKGYPVALTSSAPIEVIERRVKGFHHGYLHARTRGIDVFVVHFWPSKVGEAVQVSEAAAALMEAGKPVIVMGDFNGKIRFDEAYLKENGFHIQEDGSALLDYRLTDAFLDRGFVELVSEHSPDQHYTFGGPALIPRWAKTMEEVRSRRRRIDFIFVSPDLAAGCKSAVVRTDDEREGLHSDHYPLQCVLELPNEDRGQLPQSSP